MISDVRADVFHYRSILSCHVLEPRRAGEGASRTRRRGRPAPPAHLPRQGVAAVPQCGPQGVSALAQRHAVWEPPLHARRHRVPRLLHPERDDLARERMARTRSTVQPRLAIDGIGLPACPAGLVCTTPRYTRIRIASSPTDSCAAANWTQTCAIRATSCSALAEGQSTLGFLPFSDAIHSILNPC